MADDTRLRIINLLKVKELTGNEICMVLEKKQSNIFKYLARLRMPEVVTDRRKKNNAHHSLNKPPNNAHKELISAITKGLKDMEVFLKKMLNGYKTSSRRKVKNEN